MSLHRLLITALSLPFMTAVSTAATFNLAGDWLADESGVQGIPNGSLIMLIASTKDGDFSAPTASGYVAPGSDDVIIGAFTANDAGGLLNQGSYTGSLRANYGDSSNGLAEFDAGDPLIIRWFPTLTSADLEEIPTGAVPYGEFRSSEVLPGSDTGWIAPSSNQSTVSLSISASSVGNRYDPKGAVALQQLVAGQLLGTAILETAQAQLEISILAGGGLALSWPLLDSANPVGRLQESSDLLNWTEATVKVDTTDGVAKANVESNNGTLFYRIASE